MNRENWCFAVAQASFFRQQHIFNDHSAFRCGICSVVDGTKRCLCTCTAIHGVQVVNQGFHCLIGCTVGFPISILLCKRLYGCNLVGCQPFRELLCLCFLITVVICQTRNQTRFLLNSSRIGLYKCLWFFDVGQEFQCSCNVLQVPFPISFLHAASHCIIKVRDALSAVLVVLVGLNRNTSQSGIAGNIVWFSQEAMSSRKAMLKQLNQVNLAAGCCQRQEIQVMNVNVAVPVSLSVFRLQNSHLIEFLRSGRTIFQHRSHCSIAVDVGIFPLDVAVLCRIKRQFVHNLHEIGFDFPISGTLIAI